MPYRRTRSLSSGRREERERKLNTRPIIDKGGSIVKVYHQPQNSGIVAIVNPANNTCPERSVIDSSSAVRVGSVQNDKFLKYNESTVYPLNTRVSVCHPEPAPQSLRRRISHVQTKGGYQYAD